MEGSPEAARDIVQASFVRVVFLWFAFGSRSTLHPRIPFQSLSPLRYCSQAQIGTTIRDLQSKFETSVRGLDNAQARSLIDNPNLTRILIERSR